MVNNIPLRSVSFDTSFLLKDDVRVDEVIKNLARDRIPCFLTTTVISELEQLKVQGRITEVTYIKAMKRSTHAHTTVIDFKNRLLSDALGHACIRSMEDHGIPANHVINDCTILVSTLKNGVDLFLSEDFHFTSAITKEVIHEVKNAACTEYHLMCDTTMYSIDTRKFLMSYSRGALDLDIVQKQLHEKEKNRLKKIK